MQTKHIGLFVFTDNQWMGGVIYIQNLVKAIASLPENERCKYQLSIITIDKTHKYVQSLEHLVDQIIEIPFWERCRQGIKRLLSLKHFLWDYKFLNSCNFDFLYPYETEGQTPFNWCGWIPDFQHVFLPELFDKKEIEYRDNQHGSIARNAHKIVLSSRMAQKHFNKIYPKASQRNYVMQFRSYADPSWYELVPTEVQKKYNLSDRFFLISNQFWKHKNHQIVVDALKILRQQGINPLVVCTGGTSDNRHPDFFDKFESNLKKNGLDKQFLILGFIPRIDQIQLMRRALAVIQPSLFEGWSTVVEDARALGKSLILSDFQVHLEQAPPHAVYFKKNDSTHLASILNKLHTELEVGPLLKNEALAQKENESLMRQYGMDFINIAFGPTKKK